MYPPDDKFIRRLHLAENHFLELLLTRFTLQRTGKGTELQISFNDQTPAITQRQAKHAVLGRINNYQDRSAALQRKLEAFLIDQKGNEFTHDAPGSRDDIGFPFRYASGGTLPILRLGEEEYYCLFYRDIFPVGWNIANGGADSREELLNPVETIRRELREELIILDLYQGIRYVFKDDYGKRLDRPEFDVARRIWQKRFQYLDFENFEEREIPVKFLEGPDSLKITYGDKVHPVEGCFLNINATDFGIEIDRVGKLHVDKEVILCDGEIIGDHLDNRPVSLFEVERLNQMFQDGATEFIPDRFFYNARCYCGKDLKEVVIKECLPEIAPLRSRQEKEQWQGAERKYDLCPVTRNIMQRYLGISPPEKKVVSPADYKYFISFHHPDEALAQRVYDYLREIQAGPVFFSKETMGHSGTWGRQLDDALDAARCLIAVATHPEHLREEWPEYEWRSWFNEIQSKQKPKGSLIPFIAGFPPEKMPRPLKEQQAIVVEPGRIDQGLEKLNDLLCGGG
jgi:8-oxo-dGTP pyrophosphatase MutT (NUDIX family)